MENVSGEERDSLMRSSYNIITKSFTKTVNRFIVYQDGKNTIDIPHGKGQRSMFIDVLLAYFIEIEEYEKCDILKKLKDLVIMTGD
jgi:hypothetical protein